ncbi:MAG: hypothetical protein AB1Z23_09770 [Eubacteriales bacterium]
MSAISLYLNYGRCVSRWDEFSHWALSVKNMLYLGAFHNAEGTTAIFLEYPPAAGLFEFLFLKFQSNNYEFSLYIGMNILFFSLVLPIFSKIEYVKQKFEAILLFIIILFFPLILYPEFFRTLLVDGLLAAMFANILICYFYEENDYLKVIEIILISFVMAITKSAGAGLCGIAAAIMIIDSIFIKKSFKNINSFSKLLEQNKAYVLCIIGLITAQISWSVYLSINEVPIAHHLGVDGINDLLAVFNPKNLLEYQIQTISAFKGAFIYSGIKSVSIGSFTINLSPALLVLGFISIFILFATSNKNKDEKKKTTFFFSLILVGFFAYLFSLLILYTYYFSPYEAVRLASYSRYLSTYFLAMMIIISCAIIYSVSKGRFSRGIKYVFVGIFAIVFLFSAIFRYDSLSRSGIDDSIEIYQDYDDIAQKKDVLNYKTDRVYFISIGDKGNDFNVARYVVTPIQTLMTTDSWSIGIEPYYEGDVWTRILTLDEWIEKLKVEGYTHVYVYKSNDEFNDVYCRVFEKETVEEKTLYQIINDEGMILKKVEQ